MAKKKNSKYEESTLEAIKDLMRDQSNYFTRDVEDLDTARSALSGFGFDEKDRKVRGNKPEITIPVLNPWMNQVVSAYTSAPFGMGLKSNRQDIAAFREVFDTVQVNMADIASKALIEQLGVGYTYAYVTNELVDESRNYFEPKIKMIDARKVVVGYSEDPELDDCDIAIVIDIISKTKAKSKYDLEDYELRGNKDILNGYDVVINSKTQCSVVTCYERIASGVRVTKVVYDRIVSQTTIPLSRIPLVRFYGDTCYIEKEAHYRGVYQLISDMWKLVNFGASEIQARIATAPTANFIGDPAGYANDPEAYEVGSERMILPYMSNDGKEQIAPLQPVDKNLQIGELQASITAFMSSITQLLGSASSEGRQNETAEAVLARKSMAEATVNKYLNNLKSSMKSLGKVILEMIAYCYDVPRSSNGINIDVPALNDISGIDISVDDGPIQASQKQKNLQQIMAFYSMAKESNPQAFNTVGPAILQLSDIPTEIKQALSPIFQQGQGQLSPEVMQQMQAKDQQLQAMTEQAKQIIADRDKQLAVLQQSFLEFQNDQKLAAYQTQAKIDSDERKHAADLAWEKEKFMLEMRAKGIKLQVDMDEAEKDRQLEADQNRQKMLLDIEKDREESRRQAQQIEVPLFTPSKFT